MAKILIVLAWAGLAFSAPQRFQSRGRVTGAVDSASIVNSVLSSLDIQGVISAALARRGSGGSVSQGVSRPQVSQRTSFAPAISQVAPPRFTPSISQVVSRPQVTQVTPSFTSSTQSSGLSRGVSRNSADVVTSVLNSISPSIQRAVASALQSGSRVSSSGNFQQTQVSQVSSVNRVSSNGREG